MTGRAVVVISVLGICAASLAECKDGLCDRTPAVAACVSGDYELMTIGGQALPAQVGAGPSNAIMYYFGSMTLSPDGAWTQSIAACYSSSTPDCSTKPRVLTGTWEAKSANLVWVRYTGQTDVSEWFEASDGRLIACSDGATCPPYVWLRQ